jgi:hypothetical protein
MRCRGDPMVTAASRVPFELGSSLVVHDPSERISGDPYHIYSPLRLTKKKPRCQFKCPRGDSNARLSINEPVEWSDLH